MKIEILLGIIFVITICRTAPINDTIACVQAYIDTFEKDLDPKIFTVFKKAFPNTLETTVQHYDLTKDN
jgi:meiotically up-regulated gene 157 (Mug157) protein